MQSADTVLGVLRERGRQGLPLERLYRQLFNEQLFLVAYGRIYANDGAMTAGVDGHTPDGMGLGAIRDIIDRLRAERYQFAPVRRVWIPKKNGTRRPLGLPAWSDKLVGEVGASALGGVLRAAVLGQVTWVPARAGLSYGARRDRFDVDGHNLVHRGRHRRLLRQSRS